MWTMQQQYAGMLGTWRGPSVLEDGRDGLAEFSFQPCFGGQMIEVFGHALDAESGKTQSWGMAHMAYDEDGRVIWRHYNQRIGFATLRQIEDDPDVLAVQGPLANGLVMTMNFQLDGDELILTVSAHDAKAQQAGKRTLARMKRLGTRVQEPEE